MRSNELINKQEWSCHLMKGNDKEKIWISDIKYVLIFELLANTSYKKVHITWLNCSVYERSKAAEFSVKQYCVKKLGWTLMIILKTENQIDFKTIKLMSNNSKFYSG